MVFCFTGGAAAVLVALIFYCVPLYMESLEGKGQKCLFEVFLTCLIIKSYNAQLVRLDVNLSDSEI